VIRYHARWVLPITARPIEDGVVAVDGGRIAYVGPRAGAPSTGETRELDDTVLLPGLVNAHTHLELTALRGFLEDLSFPRWITRLQAVKKAVFDRERLLDAARLGVREGLLSGVTTFADTCDSGVAFDAMIEAGVRGIMYQEVFGPDPDGVGDSMAALGAKVDALRERATSLVRIGVSPHAPYTVSDALYRAVAEYAKRHALPIAVHIAEGEDEQQLVLKGGGVFAEALRRRGISIAPRARSGIDLLAKNGVLARDPLLIHCVHIDAADIDTIAATDCGLAHCPVSNAKLGHGVAPLLAMLNAGLAVGLGSDSMASNNQMDLLGEARAAVLAQRAASKRHDALSADAALELATIGGAKALGLADEIGSLEIGKSADLAAFPLSDVRGPAHDPAAALVFAMPGSHASLVTVAGRELVRGSQLVHDDTGLDGRIDDIARRMRAWSSSD
jgi:cytosine/adenosine deaminase-related metal-dependent hydrolase